MCTFVLMSHFVPSRTKGKKIKTADFLLHKTKGQRLIFICCGQVNFNLRLIIFFLKARLTLSYLQDFRDFRPNKIKADN